MVGDDNSDLSALLDDQTLIIDTGSNLVTNSGLLDATSDGNDILVGGINNDVLSGGQGADSVTVLTGETAAGNADAIVDNSFIEDDNSDLSALIDTATGKDVTDSVEVAQSGSDITGVDPNGGVSAATDTSEVSTLTEIGTDGGDPLSVLIDDTDPQHTV